MSRLFRSLRFALPITALFVVLALFGAHPALAGGVVGSGTPGSCTDSALNSALSTGGTVTFNCGPNAVTINVSTIKNIGINTTLDGGSKITLKASGVSFFQVYNGFTFSIKNITLTKGSSGAAGAIENFGTTQVTNVTFKSNKANGGDGGAIHNYNKLTVKNSTFQNNQATGSGGAIRDDGTKLSVKNSTFSGNKAGSQGGAVASTTNLVIKKSTFTGNKGSDGGAVYVDNNATAKISGSTFDGNHSTGNGGGVSNNGTTTITTSTIKNNTADNVGGAIANGKSLNLQASTLSGNHAVSGAGIFDFGTNDTITRSTLSGNQASGDGGGIYTIINTSITNSTLSGNQAGSGNGGGAWFQYGGASSLTFVTIANNSALYGGGIYAESSHNSQVNIQQSVLSANSGDNCSGADIVSLGHNLSSDKHCGGVFTATGDKNNKNAKLGALANNGGPTMTHLPLTGSLLINAGGTAGVNVDQRGLSRPFGAQADIGAVEVH